MDSTPPDLEAVLRDQLYQTARVNEIIAELTFEILIDNLPVIAQQACESSESREIVVEAITNLNDYQMLAIVDRLDQISKTGIDNKELANNFVNLISADFFYNIRNKTSIGAKVFCDAFTSNGKLPVERLSQSLYRIKKNALSSASNHINTR
jgi:hypothetical protein